MVDDEHIFRCICIVKFVAKYFTMSNNIIILYNLRKTEHANLLLYFNNFLSLSYLSIYLSFLYNYFVFCI